VILQTIFLGRDENRKGVKSILNSGRDSFYHLEVLRSMVLIGDDKFDI